MDETQRRLIAQVMQRVQATLQAATPQMAQPVTDWMRALAGGHAPEAYFTHDLAFPTLLLPWWLEQSLGREPATAFQADIAYSSINGYYFIRMIDNVMDGEATVETKLLPALAFFHTEFQTPYQKHFAPEHPFWALYRTVWFGTAEAAIHDARLDDITLEMFIQASAQKVRAALIPVAAVCHHYGRADLTGVWSEFVLRMGKWHQMFNDIFDWYKDSSTGNMTYFLSEAQRRKRNTEAPMDWIVRTGFQAGCDTLRTWMCDAQALAAQLNCPPLAHYLVERSALFEHRADAALSGLGALAKLAAVFK